ncbi:MAG: FadR/GntR family transcriptional regulator [Pseudomonadota bacterium]|jgi:GntR family transcriptional repressor for pyruvate dehydrogenase complex|uniref:Transcriptional regulator, GntR family n=1 Tax=hydrothermal vent metagenome TaxID=652676 RepID=A0A160TGX2_9ZZZZ
MPKKQLTRPIAAPSAATPQPDSRKLYQQVAAAVAGAIQRGEFAPGQRIPSERDLAEEYKVSRPTIREAMIALDVIGLVKTRHGSGIFVVDNPPKDAAMIGLDIGAFELTEARRLFEGEAAALAAVSITDDEIAALETLIGEMERENLENISGEHADRSFHLTIARATRNSAVVDVVESLWDARYRSPLCAHMLERARSVGVQPRIDEHQRILAALRDRDPHAARREMRDHLARVIDGLLTATESDTFERARAEVEAKRSDLARRVAV